MSNKNSIINVHLKVFAFVLLILALAATTAFVPGPLEATHATGGQNIKGSSLSASLPNGFNKTSPVNGAPNLVTSLTLKWSSSSNAKYYEYCLDTNNNNDCDTTWISTGSKKSIILSGLTQGTTYYWQVRATNGTGTTYANGIITAWWSFSTALTPGNFTKAAPTTGVTNQPDKVMLSWNPSSNVTDYQYCIDTKNNKSCDTQWISTLGATSIVTQALIPNKVYYWQVRAVNGTYPTYADGSANWWQFKVSPVPGSFRKTSPVDAAVDQASSLTLTWSTSLAATSYQYCIDTTNDDACSTWKSAGTNKSITVTGLIPGVTYFWQARSTNASGTTYADGSSTWWSFSIVPLPGDFNKSGPADGSTNLLLNPTLSWTKSTDATSYVYCIDTNNNNSCDKSWVSTGANTSITLNSLAQGTKYYWQVRAKNGAGSVNADSIDPTWYSFKTASLPGAFSKSKPANGATKPSTVTLSWAAGSNATEYEYCIDTVGDNLCNSLWVSTGTDLNVVLNSLEPVTKYYWEVRAKNFAGDTLANAGTWWSFTTSQIPGAFSKSNPADTAINLPSKVTLSWTSSANAEAYQYCIDNIDNGSCDTSWITTKTATSVTTAALLPDTTYFWQVLATSGGNGIYADGSADNWRSFTVGSLPGAFGKISPGNGMQNLLMPLSTLPDNVAKRGYTIGVWLVWAPSSSASSYEYCIDRTNNNSCDTSWISVGNTSSILLNIFKPGYTYYWQVRSKNDVGVTYADGSSTNWWTFSISPN